MPKRCQSLSSSSKGNDVPCLRVVRFCCMLSLHDETVLLSVVLSFKQTILAGSVTIRCERYYFATIYTYRHLVYKLFLCVCRPCVAFKVLNSFDHRQDVLDWCFLTKKIFFNFSNFVHNLI